jgi:hypothetical protein
MATDLLQKARDYIYRDYGSWYKSYNDIFNTIDDLRESYGKKGTGQASSKDELNKWYSDLEKHRRSLI